MIGDTDIDAVRRRTSLGERITQLRRQAGLSQVALSRSCGISLGELNNIEDGLVHFSSPVLLSLCRALKVDILAVFQLHDDQARIDHQLAGDRPRSAGPH